MTPKKAFSYTEACSGTAVALLRCKINKRNIFIYSKLNEASYFQLYLTVYHGYV